MISNSISNERNWFEALMDLIFSCSNVVKKTDISIDITEITVCEITGDIQVVLKFNINYSQTMHLNDILTSEKIIAQLSPQAKRILTCLIARELQASESITRDFNLMDLRDDYMMKIYQDIKRINSWH